MRPVRPQLIFFSENCVDMHSGRAFCHVFPMTSMLHENMTGFRCAVSSSAASLTSSSALTASSPSASATLRTTATAAATGSGAPRQPQLSLSCGCSACPDSQAASYHEPYISHINAEHGPDKHFNLLHTSIDRLCGCDHPAFVSFKGASSGFCGPLLYYKPSSAQNQSVPD